MTNPHTETVRLFNEWLDAELRKGAHSGQSETSRTTASVVQGQGVSPVSTPRVAGALPSNDNQPGE